MTITANFRYNVEWEKIRPVGRIVKSWTGHERVISQLNEFEDLGIWPAQQMLEKKIKLFTKPYKILSFSNLQN